MPKKSKSKPEAAAEGTPKVTVRTAPGLPAKLFPTGGYELFASIDNEFVMPFRRADHFDLGDVTEIPAGHSVYLAPHPHAVVRGLYLPGAPQFFGEGKLQVLVHNLGREIVTVRRGDPLALLFLVPTTLFEVGSEQ